LHRGWLVVRCRHIRFTPSSEHSRCESVRRRSGRDFSDSHPKFGFDPQAAMKILVTGGAGFIGSSFVRYVLRNSSDIEIVNYDLLTYAGNLRNLDEVVEHPRYEFIRGDIADAGQVENLFARHRFDAVVNFAAETHVDRSILDSAPFVRTNVEGTRCLLETARRYKVAKFVQISTDEVYGSLGATGSFREDTA